MSLWVVGTDTEVGKTIISAMIVARYRTDHTVAYWKPVATGSRDERDTVTVAELCPGATILPETHLFREPLSPHLAARLDGGRADPDAILEAYDRHRADAAERDLVIEGAGGVLVPLTDDGDMLIDLLPRFDLPVVVVARSTLGTINHSLLTLEALRRRDLDVAGVVLNGPPNLENRKAIERFGNVDILAEVPHLDPLDATALGRSATEDFDTAGRLARCFR